MKDAAKSHWQVRPLGEVVTLNYGKALARSEREPNGSIPVYGANGVMDWSEHTLTEGPSLVIGRKGSAGEVTRVDGPFWPSDVTYYTTHDENALDFDFLHYTLRTLNLPSMARGVKPGINRNDVYALPIPLPPLEEQQRIVAVLDKAFEGLARARTHAEANLQNARELFESYLAAAFSGDETGWDECELNDHVRFIDYRGKTPPKTESGIRLITAKNVKMGFIQREPEEFILESAYEGWMTRGFPKLGDVLFTTEAPLANVAQLDTEETVVIGQRLITMQSDQDVILPEFLKFSLMSPPMQSEIHRRGTGATVVGIKAKLLKTVPLRFPKNLVRQRAIAANCQSAHDNMERLEEAFRGKLQDLDDLRQSLLQKAFAGELT